MDLLSMRSPVARYLLGDLASNESRQMEESTLGNSELRREIEVAEEELIAAYAVGILRIDDRLRFEKNFLSSNDWRSDGRKIKLKFAQDWLRKGESLSSDLTTTFHRYILRDMPLDEEAEFAHKLLLDEDCQAKLGAAENEMLIAYFHDQMSRFDKESFEFNYLVNERMIQKLRFAQIMCDYVHRASMASHSHSDRP